MQRLVCDWVREFGATGSDTRLKSIEKNKTDDCFLPNTPQIALRIDVAGGLEWPQRLR